MSSHKVDRALYGPSWAEIIIGALLSVIIGAVLGVVILVMKPVLKVSELPKDAPAGQIYYVAGGMSPARTEDVAKKQKALVDGETVSFTEGDLEALFTPPDAKNLKPSAKPVAPDKFLTLGVPDFHIKGAQMAIGEPLTISLYGAFTTVTMQATGSFEKQNGVYTYVPTHILVGSLPLDRVPFAVDLLGKKLMAIVALPPDVTAAWSKLSEVGFQDRMLKVVPAPH